MKMKRSGFTLVELLAVIVILAIISLIATPIILNIIDTARNDAYTDSAYGYLEAAKLDYATTATGNDAHIKWGSTEDLTSTPPTYNIKISGTQSSSYNFEFDTTTGNFKSGGTIKFNSDAFVCTIQDDGAHLECN